MATSCSSVLGALSWRLPIAIGYELAHRLAAIAETPTEGNAIGPSLHLRHAPLFGLNRQISEEASVRVLAASEPENFFASHNGAGKAGRALHPRSRAYSRPKKNGESEQF